MNLYFLRHTKAIEPGKEGIKDDDGRPLSGKDELVYCSRFQTSSVLLCRIHIIDALTDIVLRQ